MIPADLTARLRLLTEASFFSKEPPEVNALNGSREVSEELPDFSPGQRIIATLREQRPDETFRALINGREYTLALPRQHGRAGQTLDLVVTQATPKAVVATLAEPGTQAASTSLSQAGRLISFLLTGQPPSAATSLAAGHPVLREPPASGSQILPQLRQAVSESGLFYESQLARWLAGTVSTDTLLRQPQSQLTRGGETTGLRPPTTGATADEGAPDGAPTANPSGRPAATPNSPASAGQISAQPNPAGSAPADEAEQANSLHAASASQRQAPQAANNLVHERLVPLVHQQLDALATHNYVWQGAIWPGQQMEWEIEEPPERDGATEEPGDGGWKTTLRLTLPRLGGIEARLHLTPAGVAMHLSAREPETAAALAEARQQLADALAGADVPLTGMLVDLAAAGSPKP